MKELSDNTIMWGARIFIIVGIVLFIWWICRKKNYQYKGIFRYKNWGKKIGGKVKRRRVNKTEEICRNIIEQIYNKPFPSVRPNFLKSPRTGKNLELDCYNQDLKIAIEYNGQQHYQFTPHFHKSKKDFYAQVHRDNWKRKKCRENGITLIEIPFWIPQEKLAEFIKAELRKKGF